MQQRHTYTPIFADPKCPPSTEILSLVKDISNLEILVEQAKTHLNNRATLSMKEIEMMERVIQLGGQHIPEFKETVSSTLR